MHTFSIYFWLYKLEYLIHKIKNVIVQTKTWSQKMREKKI